MRQPEQGKRGRRMKVVKRDRGMKVVEVPVYDLLLVDDDHQAPKPRAVRKNVRIIKRKGGKTKEFLEGKEMASRKREERGG